VELAAATTLVTLKPEGQTLPCNWAVWGGDAEWLRFCADGTISLRELKLHNKDRVGDRQHRAADVLGQLIGPKLDLRVLVWGQAFIP
jgi:hypothetical protein